MNVLCDVMCVCEALIARQEVAWFIIRVVVGATVCAGAAGSQDNSYPPVQISTTLTGHVDNNL